MTKLIHSCQKLLLLFLLLQTNPLLITAQHRSAGLLAHHVTATAPQGQQIPEASKPSTPEEAKWWQQIREAAKEFAVATARKQDALIEASNRHSFKHGFIPDDEKDLLPRSELDKLNETIKATRQKYTELLRGGKERSYRPLIPDGRPLLLQPTKPLYTERARQNKIAGTVAVRVLFLADGAIGEVQIVSGLGYGLDERATEAVRGIVFLPARVKEQFVHYWIRVEVEFNLR